MSCTAVRPTAFSGIRRAFGVRIPRIRGIRLYPCARADRQLGPPVCTDTHKVTRQPQPLHSKGLDPHYTISERQILPSANSGGGREGNIPPRWGHGQGTPGHGQAPLPFHAEVCPRTPRGPAPPRRLSLPTRKQARGKQRPYTTTQQVTAASSPIRPRKRNKKINIGMLTKSHKRAKTKVRCHGVT